MSAQVQERYKPGSVSLGLVQAQCASKKKKNGRRLFASLPRMTDDWGKQFWCSKDGVENDGSPALARSTTFPQPATTTQGLWGALLELQRRRLLYVRACGGCLYLAVLTPFGLCGHTYNDNKATCMMFSPCSGVPKMSSIMSHARTIHRRCI